MLIFLVIITVLFVLVSLLTCQCLTYIVPTAYLRAAQISVVGCNILALLIFFSGGRRANKILLAIVCAMVVAEIIFGLSVALAVGIRKIWQLVMNVPVDNERRQFLRVAMLYPVAAIGLSSYGSLVERKSTVIREYDIPVEGEFPAYKVAQISDVHLGPFFDLDDLDELLAKTADCGADLLAVTGDIFDDEKQNEQAVKLLGRYTERFPDGIFFCWGNHEYYRHPSRIAEYLRQTPVNLLVNESMKVRDGNRPLYLAGVDYPMNRPRFDELRDEYSEAALADIPASAVTILLAHHPEFIDNARAAKVTLTLTGHTHGGQFGIGGVPLIPVFKYNRGMVEKDGSFGYVHCGNGSWFPLRLGCPPEIACFTLTGTTKGTT